LIAGDANTARRGYCAGAFVEGALVDGISDVVSAGFWQPVNNPM